MEKYNGKCQICGWGEINPYTNKTPLQVHHIDGNSENNIENNLQLLCPNCHSLTENFGSRNKNAPRGKSTYYGKAKVD
jgi:predicted HNH restriction endonuclease